MEMTAIIAANRKNMASIDLKRKKDI